VNRDMPAGEPDAISSMVSHNQRLIMKHHILASGLVVMSIDGVASPTCMPDLPGSLHTCLRSLVALIGMVESAG
jgi:hypothetical protein